MSPSPLFVHQRIVLALATLLRAWAQAGKHGVVAIAPFDVVLDNENVVQPDVVFVRRDRRQIIHGRCHGVPDLVVEILSSQPWLDRKAKMEIYARFKVPAYWIVDPESCTLECYSHDGRGYRVSNVFAREEVGSPEGFDGLTIPLAELWKDDLSE